MNDSHIVLLTYMSCDQVVKYWPQRNSEGLLVWKYLLRRDDPVSVCGMDMVTLSLFFFLPSLVVDCMYYPPQSSHLPPGQPRERNLSRNMA